MTENTIAPSASLIEIHGLALRVLSALDALAIKAHFKRMNNVDRFTRFFSAMSDEGIDRYVDGFDWSRMAATALFKNEDIIALAELGWEAGTRPGSAELAVSVEPGFRRRGAASWLVDEVVGQGRLRVVRRMHASWVGGNDAVARIMRRHDAKIWLNGSHWRGETVIG
jgi:GNAT superfamily N-acetyltransferase